MIPEGWKLVPIKPTVEMEEAGAKGSGEDSISVALGAWEAMLAAAPEPAFGSGYWDEKHGGWVTKYD